MRHVTTLSPFCIETEPREVKQLGQGLGVAGVGFNPRQSDSRVSYTVFCHLGWMDSGRAGGVTECNESWWLFLLKPGFAPGAELI